VHDVLFFYPNYQTMLLTNHSPPPVPAEYRASRLSSTLKVQLTKKADKYPISNPAIIFSSVAETCSQLRSKRSLIT